MKLAPHGTAEARRRRRLHQSTTMATFSSSLAPADLAQMDPSAATFSVGAYTGKMEGSPEFAANLELTAEQVNMTSALDEGVAQPAKKDVSPSEWHQALVQAGFGDLGIQHTHSRVAEEDGPYKRENAVDVAAVFPQSQGNVYASEDGDGGGGGGPPVGLIVGLVVPVGVGLLSFGAYKANEERKRRAKLAKIPLNVTTPTNPKHDNPLDEKIAIALGGAPPQHGSTKTTTNMLASRLSTVNEGGEEEETQFQAPTPSRAGGTARVMNPVFAA